MRRQRKPRKTNKPKPSFTINVMNLQGPSCDDGQIFPQLQQLSRATGPFVVSPEFHHQQTAQVRDFHPVLQHQNNPTFPRWQDLLERESSGTAETSNFQYQPISEVQNFQPIFQPSNQVSGQSAGPSQTAQTLIFRNPNLSGITDIQHQPVHQSFPQREQLMQHTEQFQFSSMPPCLPNSLSMLSDMSHGPSIAIPQHAQPTSILERLLQSPPLPDFQDDQQSTSQPPLDFLGILASNQPQPTPQFDSDFSLRFSPPQSTDHSPSSSSFSQPNMDSPALQPSSQPPQEPVQNTQNRLQLKLLFQPAHKLPPQTLDKLMELVVENKEFVWKDKENSSIPPENVGEYHEQLNFFENQHLVRIEQLKVFIDVDQKIWVHIYHNFYQIQAYLPDNYSDSKKDYEKWMNVNRGCYTDMMAIERKISNLNGDHVDKRAKILQEEQNDKLCLYRTKLDPPFSNRLAKIQRILLISKRTGISVEQLLKEDQRKSSEVSEVVTQENQQDILEESGNVQEEQMPQFKKEVCVSPMLEMNVRGLDVMEVGQDQNAVPSTLLSLLEGSEPRLGATGTDSATPSPSSSTLSQVVSPRPHAEQSNGTLYNISITRSMDENSLQAVFNNCLRLLQQTKIAEEKKKAVKTAEGELAGISEEIQKFTPQLAKLNARIAKLQEEQIILQSELEGIKAEKVNMANKVRNLQQLRDEWSSAESTAKANLEFIRGNKTRTDEEFTEFCGTIHVASLHRNILVSANLCYRKMNEFDRQKFDFFTKKLLDLDSIENATGEALTRATAEFKKNKDLLQEELRNVKEAYEREQNALKELPKIENLLRDAQEEKSTINATLADLEIQKNGKEELVKDAEKAIADAEKEIKLLEKQSACQKTDKVTRTAGSLSARGAGSLSSDSVSALLPHADLSPSGSPATPPMHQNENVQENPLVIRIPMNRRREAYAIQRRESGLQEEEDYSGEGVTEGEENEVEGEKNDGTQQQYGDERMDEERGDGESQQMWCTQQQQPNYDWGAQSGGKRPRGRSPGSGGRKRRNERNDSSSFETENRRIKRTNIKNDYGY